MTPISSRVLDYVGTRTGFAVGGQISRKDLVEIVQTAEKRGFDTFWLTEGSGKDALTQIAALGPVTSKIKLGTGVILLFSRSPSIIAMSTASLDEITGNRFVLGIGTGGPSVLNNHGVQFEKPLDRMRDYVTLIKKLLKGETVVYSGKAYSLNGVKLAFPAPRPNHPVYIAAMNPSICQLAGEIADGVIFYMLSPEVAKRAVGDVKVGAEKVGKKLSDVDVTCFILAHPDTSEQGILGLKQQLAGFSKSGPYKKVLSEAGFAKEMEEAAKALARGDDKAAVKAISDRMAESVSLVGDPFKWDKMLQKYREVGVGQPIIFPTGATQRSMEMLRKALSANTG